MKKILHYACVAAMAITLSINSNAQKVGESVLKDVITVHQANGIYSVYEKDGKYGLVMNHNYLDVALEAQFEDIYIEDFYESNYYIIVKKDGKWGALRYKKPVVPFMYDMLTPFRSITIDGEKVWYSTATLNGETFLIDSENNRINL